MRIVQGAPGTTSSTLTSTSWECQKEKKQGIENICEKMIENLPNVENEIDI